MKVLVGESDTYEGQSVDVAYKAHSGVRRPTENVNMFRTWRSQDFPSWVCRVSGSTTSNIPADYCARQGHSNRYDGVVGPTQDGIDTPPPAARARAHRSVASSKRTRASSGTGRAIRTTASGSAASTASGKDRPQRP